MPFLFSRLHDHIAGLDFVQAIGPNLIMHIVDSAIIFPVVYIIGLHWPLVT